MGVSWLEEKVKEKAKEKAKGKANTNPSEDALTIEDMMPKIDFKKDSHQSQT